MRLHGVFLEGLIFKLQFRMLPFNFQMPNLAVEYIRWCSLRILVILAEWNFNVQINLHQNVWCSGWTTILKGDNEDQITKCLSTSSKLLNNKVNLNFLKTANMYWASNNYDSALVLHWQIQTKLLKTGGKNKHNKETNKMFPLAFCLKFSSHGDVCWCNTVQLFYLELKEKPVI